jgi:hypothetical protein
VQPNHYYDGYNHVMTCEVTGIDSKNLAIQLSVQTVHKGDYSAKAITLSTDDSARLEDVLSVGKGQSIVVFAGKDRPVTKRNEIVYYVGGGKWFKAEMTDDPTKWILTGNADAGKVGAEIMFGVYNGSVDQFSRMMADHAANTAYYPATPFTRFTSTTLAMLPGEGRGVGLGDLNGDGHLDLVATSLGGTHLWMGDGQGGFTEKTPEVLKSLAANSVSLADADLDGDLDLLLDASLFLNDQGTLTKTDALPEQTDVHSSAFVELNQDGYPDVVISRKDAGLAAFINPKSAKPFTDATADLGLDQELNGAKATGYFDAADWNRDGKTDLLYLTGPGLLLLAGESGFQVTPVGMDEEYEFGTGVMAPVVAPDAMTAYIATTESKLLVDNSGENGAVRDILRYGNEIQDDISDMFMTVADDFNMDGNLDLYATTLSEGSPSFFVTNRGYGSFMMPTKYAQHTVFPSEVYNAATWGVATGDLNGDGATDAVVTEVNGNVHVLLNDILNHRPQEVKVSHILEVRKQIAARSVTFQIPSNQPGLIGSRFDLKNARGQIITSKQIGNNIGSGCSSDRQVILTVREPGPYTLDILWGNGKQVTGVPVDLGESSPRHQSLDLAPHLK